MLVGDNSDVIGSESSGMGVVAIGHAAAPHMGWDDLEGALSEISDKHI